MFRAVSRLLSLSLVLWLAGIASAQISGAIYTTSADGKTVNANSFATKDLVYLNGGPQNPNGSGLPDGVYYFRVTDPSGATLLSTDPAACRQVLVSGGKMAGPFGVCHHAAGDLNVLNGQIGVQLIPYNDTPNGGGVYKVWLISQAAGCNTSVGADGITINFASNCAKTDNFKVLGGGVVTPNSVLSGVKYRDANKNGTMDTGEPVLIGWTIQLTDSVNGNQQTTTDAGGLYSFAVPVGATVSICEVLQSGWVQYGPIAGATAGPFTANGSKCWTGTVGQSDSQGLDFGNLDKIRLSGLKFYDTDKDQTQDAGEPSLSGWTIQLKDATNTNVLQSATTGPDGTYYFEVTPGTLVNICEVQVSAYVQSTTPTCYAVTATADRSDVNFGNYIPVSGMKYYDVNRNGVNNAEAGIDGFLVQLSWCDNATCAVALPYPVVVATKTTGPGGTWSAVMPPPPIAPAPPLLFYRACEVLPLSTTYGTWTQTGPIAPASNSDNSAYVVGRCWVGQVGLAGAVAPPTPGTGLDFGNICVGPKLGLTLGYWSNKNGQARIVTPDDLNALSALNLRSANGSHFDPTTKSSLATWLLAANATNMANMLSAQMAATYLNTVRNGLSGGVQVWFNGGWVTISAAITTANGLLSDTTCGTSCVVLSGNTLRSEMEAYKTLFDSINNNTALIGPGSCPRVYP